MVRFSSRADAQRPLGLPRRALADQRDHRRPGLEQPDQPRVVGGAAARPPRHPERAQLGLPELRRIGEERIVGRVGAGPAALDIVDAERVQLAGDAQLVLDARSRRPGSARRRAGWCRRGRCARRSCAAPVGGAVGAVFEDDACFHKLVPNRVCAAEIASPCGRSVALLIADADISISSDCCIPPNVS